MVDLLPERGDSHGAGCLDTDLDALTEAIDRIVQSGPLSLVDTDSFEYLLCQHARMEAVVSQATAAFDASGNWEFDGARSAAGWIMTRCRLPKSLARRMIRRGRDLRHLPVVAAAWSRGAITAAQVDLVTPLLTPATVEALARDEELLVEQASHLPYRAFVRVVDYWKQLADPDGSERDDEAKRAARQVYLAKSYDGMWLGQMTLDPISGAIVSEELERLEKELFESDWAEKKASLGREPLLAELARTPGQRRADALVEMATRSQTAPADGRRPAALFSVLVDHRTLCQRVCELANGTVVSPGSLLPWLTEGYFERVVFAADSRVEVSATSRIYSGATRRAIELRDRECTHPYCDVPADKCQVDHFIPFSQGGLTDQENGRLLCGPHNRGRHSRPPPDD